MTTTFDTWFYSTRDEANKIDGVGVPIGTTILYKHCHNDVTAFAAVCELLEQAFNAGQVPADWLPTAENINALPEPLRRYIHDMVSNADPAGTVREVTQLRDQVRELSASNRLLRDQVAAIEAQGATVEETDLLTIAYMDGFAKGKDAALVKGVPDGMCERICSAIKAADDRSVGEADYMLDSNDCIRIVRECFASAPPAPQVKPDRAGMVYYKKDGCKAPSADHSDCICWSPAPQADPVIPSDIETDCEPAPQEVVEHQSALAEEAQELSKILAGMGEGGYDLETLYTTCQADGDAFVRRAADLLAEMASVASAQQARAVQQGPVIESDMFWDHEDPEEFGHEISDIVCNYCPGDKVKIDCAFRMQTITVLVKEDWGYEIVSGSVTHPAQQAKPQPLSDERALEIFNDLEKFMDQIEDEDISDERLAGKSMQFILGRVAAIEAAHGIKEHP